MVNMNVLKLKTSLVSLCALTLISCGGGGGGGSVSTPNSGGSGSGTPPTNRAPVVVFDAPEFAFEKGALRFDATDSYDPDNDTQLEITIEQISGTPATHLYSIGGSGSGFEVWSAPEYDGSASETLTFRVTASDYQGLSSSRNFTVLVEADTLPGQPVARFADKIDLLVGNTGNIGPDGHPDEVMIVRHDASGISNLAWLGGNFRYFSTEILLQEVSPYIANANFETIDFVQYDSLNFNLAPAPTEEFTVLESDEDRIRWFYSDRDRDDESNYVYLESTQIDIESPCFIHRRMSTGRNFIWVGHKSGGVSLVELNPIKGTDGKARDFTYSKILTTATDRSLCYIHPTDLSDNDLWPVIDGQTILYPSALAIDYDSNDLVVLGDPRDGGDRYAEIKSIPLQTETSEILNVVDVVARGEPNRVPRFMFVLLSDGQENGIHRLVYIKQDTYSSEISQETFSYEGAPPVGLHLGPIGGDPDGGQYSLDVAITTSGDFGVFFDTTGAGISNPPTYAEPVTFPMAPGGVSSVSIDFDDAIDHEILVNYPESKTLRVYDLGE